MFGRFPSAIFIMVSFPFDEVLGFSIASPFLDDHFCFKFFVIIYHCGWGRILVSIREFHVVVVDPGFQEVDMKYWVDLEFPI